MVKYIILECKFLKNKKKTNLMGYYYLLGHILINSLKNINFFLTCLQIYASIKYLYTCIYEKLVKFTKKVIKK